MGPYLPQHIHVCMYVYIDGPVLTNNIFQNSQVASLLSYGYVRELYNRMAISKVIGNSWAGPYVGLREGYVEKHANALEGEPAGCSWM